MTEQDDPANVPGFQWYKGREPLSVPFTTPQNPERISEGSDESVIQDLVSALKMSKRERLASIHQIPECSEKTVSAILRLLRHLSESDIGAMNSYTFVGAVIDHLNIAQPDETTIAEIRSMQRLLKLLGG